MYKDSLTYIYGRHPVAEALEARPDVVLRIFIVEGADDAKLTAVFKQKGVTVTYVKPNALPKTIDTDATHQGYIAEINPDKLVVDFNDFIRTEAITNNTAFVLLDEIQDPHNVGAIIRSAAGFGVRGVLIPQHNQAQVTGTVIKVSAGMAFRVPLVAIGNVNETIRTLKDKGFWIYGLDEDGDHPLHQEQFDVPAVFVLGNEAKGIREKTKDICDIKLSIKLHPHCESLNVAASTAITLYAWSAQHRGVLQ